MDEQITVTMLARRLEALENPYQALSKAVAEGVLAALREAGVGPDMTEALPPTPTPASPPPGPDVEVITKDAAQRIAESLKEAAINTPEAFPILGALPPGTLIYEEGLAKLLGKCNASIRRAVKRREFPRPVRLMGKRAWTVGAIVKHMNARLEDADQNYKRLMRRFPELDK